MIKHTIVIMCALLFLAPSVSTAEAPGTPANEEGPPQIGGPFSLIDQAGRNVTDEDFRGNFLLVSFGYTNCPDICPTTLMTLASAINMLGAEGRSLRPIFISLDPARDSPARLKEYVGSFGPQFVGLTGPEPFVASVAKRYHIKYAKVERNSGDYSIDHAAGIFLMGPDGAFLKRFPHDLAARELATAIRQILRSID